MPITRPDVMQACDVMEDVAVAYSINKIMRMTAPTACVGRQNPLQKLTELLRVEMAQVSWQSDSTIFHSAPRPF